MAVNFQWCNIWPNRVLLYRPVLLCPHCGAHCVCVRATANIVGVHRGHNLQTGTRSSRSSNSTLFSLSLSLYLSSYPVIFFSFLLCSALLLLLSTDVVVFRPFRVLCVHLFIRCVLSVVQQSQLVSRPFVCFFCFFVCFFFCLKY